MSDRHQVVEALLRNWSTEQQSQNKQNEQKQKDWEKGES